MSVNWLLCMEYWRHLLQVTGMKEKKWVKCVGGPGGDKKKNKKVYDTWYSQAVTHPSTNQARRCLTSVIGREPVLSTWYGRRHLNAVYIATTSAGGCKNCYFEWKCVNKQQRGLYLKVCGLTLYFLVSVDCVSWSKRDRSEGARTTSGVCTSRWRAVHFPL